MKWTNGEGKRWAVLGRTRIADLHDPNRTYLSRVRIIETPWFGVYLHAIRLPDSDRHLHDHPWSFSSLILLGGYIEEHASNLDQARSRDTTYRVWHQGSWHAMGLPEYHAITVLHRQPTWTLVFVGRRQRSWGYATATGRVDHNEYLLPWRSR